MWMAIAIIGIPVAMIIAGLFGFLVGRKSAPISGGSGPVLQQELADAQGENLHLRANNDQGNQELQKVRQENAELQNRLIEMTQEMAAGGGPAPAQASAAPTGQPAGELPALKTQIFGGELTPDLGTKPYEEPTTESKPFGPGGGDLGEKPPLFGGGVGTPATALYDVGDATNENEITEPKENIIPHASGGAEREEEAPEAPSTRIVNMDSMFASSKSEANPLPARRGARQSAPGRSADVKPPPKVQAVQPPPVAVTPPPRMVDASQAPQLIEPRPPQSRSSSGSPAFDSAPPLQRDDGHEDTELPTDIIDVEQMMGDRAKMPPLQSDDDAPTNVVDVPEDADTEAPTARRTRRR